MKRHGNKTRGDKANFEIGDKVLLNSKNLNLNIPSRKLGYQHLGPFTIIEKIGEVSYKLELPRTMRIHPVFHESLLKPYNKDDNPNREQFAHPDPEVIDGEPEYEVEEIIDFDTEEHPNQYKVRWKGYQENDDSWEPISNLENSPELLWRYHTDNSDKSIPAKVRKWIRNWRVLQGAAIILGGMNY